MFNFLSQLLQMMRFVTFVLAGMAVSLHVFSQEVTIEKSASYPGGMGKFYQYVDSELKYPRSFRKKKLKGRVIVSFIVNDNGSIADESVRALPKNEIDPGLMSRDMLLTDKEFQDEAIRIMRNCPDWIPAEQKKKPVMQLFTMPILFKGP